MCKNRERKPVAYKQTFVKLPRSTLCSDQNRQRHDKKELHAEQKASEGTGEDEADI
jgi:hypothetical protein